MEKSSFSRKLIAYALALELAIALALALGLSPMAAFAAESSEVNQESAVLAAQSGDASARTVVADNALTTASDTLATQAYKSYSSKKITKKNPVVVIRVSYATGSFNGNPYGGVYSAAPVKRAAGYELYDVVLWPDRICCYRFGRPFDQILTKYWSTHDAPATEKARDKAGVKLREKYCIYSKKVACGDYENTDNSSAKYQAFAGIFKAVKKRTPSKHVVLKYSGHGGGVNLFCAIDQTYTIKTLKAGVKTFGAKFAIIDYGTNCRSASAWTLDQYAPYTDYMIMCQQDWGGWQWDKKVYTAEGFIKESYLHKDSDSRYHEAFKVGGTVRAAAKKLAALNRDEWTDLASGYIKKNKMECSNVAVDTKAFAKLLAAMWDQGYTWSGGDLYGYIKGSSTLKSLYKKAVIAYESTRSLGFTWSSNDRGITNW